MSTPAAPIQRRADLDWIRVAAFGLLILFHVGLVFAPWDWHVHSRHSFGWLQEAVLATGPWRLTLLFLVSGAALRFMSRRLTAGEVLKARAARLVPPFLFGVLVLVPPQAWLEALDKGRWSGTLLDWWLQQFSLDGIARGVPLNHLWFVLYIAVYSLAAVGLLARPAWLAAMERWLTQTLTGWKMLALPILYLIVVRLALFPFFGLTNHLGNDWYNHAVSLGVFLFGFATATSEPIWTALEQQRWRAVGVAIIALPLLMIMEGHPGGMAFGGSVKSTVFAIDQWATIAAILGFGARHLRRADGPALRYLTDAVFPCYLAHQTLLVIAVYLIKPHNLPAVPEAALLTVITLGGSLLVYEIVRRLGPIRPLWGLKRYPRPAPAAAPAAPDAPPETRKAA